ncbi:MAG: exopolysaccharide Pel transporter PelG [Deltaproteobacteria bacterium]|nr:exopolysaccharide Pel transporter PelG [Deltaproteobacteria bacterium]
MAGIGFRISQLLRSDDLYTRIGGMIASVVLSSGPWLCTIISIGTISIITSNDLDPQQKQTFRVIINYTYAMSLIGFALLEMVATRYVADTIYVRQEKVLPTLFSLLSLLIFAIATLFGTLFYWLTGMDWQTILMASALLSVVTFIWNAMIFLSCCKDYLAIVLSFIAGTAGSILATWICTRIFHLGLGGQLLGFLVGQVVIAACLIYRIFREFGTDFLTPRDFLFHCKHHRMLIFVGLFYATAIWIDKIIFWVSPSTSERVGSLFYKSSAYDSGMFLAYLFVVPSMAYFLVKIETEFYLSYRKYFSLIDNRAPLNLIEKGRMELISVTRQNMAGLCIFQGFITIPALLLAEQIIESVGLPPIYTTVFRYGLIAASVHMLMQFANILILYFDLPSIVLRNYFVFLVLNGCLSALSTYMDYRYHGVAYVLAALAALILSAWSLREVLRDLNFHIFMKQPFAKPTSIPLILEKVSLK